jgi:two-component system LytT family response regulator
MSLTAVIVDDEKLARELILEYLEQFPEIEVIAQYDNGEQAIRKINELKPDILFLDVRMPGCSGFEVLENLNNIPMIIFSTAYSQYALKAFEVSAVDYLLKPYSQERFNRAVVAAMKQDRRYEEMSDKIIRLMNMIQRSQNQSPLQRLFVKVKDRVVPVDISTIEWLEAQDDYTRLHTQNSSFLVGQTLTHLLALLDPGLFIRIHRSSAVNLQYIEEIIKSFKGNYLVRMTSGAKLPVGRTWLKQLKKKII